MPTKSVIEPSKKLFFCIMKQGRLFLFYLITFILASLAAQCSRILVTMNFILFVILPTYISLQMHGADGQRDKRQLQCDYDGSKNINRDEFIWCFWSQNILFKRTFYRTYSRYDRNRDGNLSQQELGQLFDELDTNKDRKLTDDERNKVKPPI